MGSDREIIYPAPARRNPRRDASLPTGVAFFQQNRRHVLIRHDLSDHDLEQIAELDRREVDPPIEVATATWSQAGQLDLWVKSGRIGGVVFAVRSAASGGSGLLIFVR
jgi:hypothetical protein